jgi:hypothetical protein
VGHRLGRALAAGRDHRRRGEPSEQLCQRPPPRLRRVCAEAVVDGEVGRRHPELAEPGRRRSRVRTDEHGLEGAAGRLGIAAGERQRLPRDVVRGAAGMLDEDENGRH